jgi:hypothetical protein
MMELNPLTLTGDPSLYVALRYSTVPGKAENYRHVYAQKYGKFGEGIIKAVSAFLYSQNGQFKAIHMASVYTYPDGSVTLRSQRYHGMFIS